MSGMPTVDYQSQPPEESSEREQKPSDVVAGKLLSVFLLFFGLPFVATLGVGIYGALVYPERFSIIVAVVAGVCGVMGIAMWAAGIQLLRRKA